MNRVLFKKRANPFIPCEKNTIYGWTVLYEEEDTVMEIEDLILLLYEGNNWNLEGHAS